MSYKNLYDHENYQQICTQKEFLIVLTVSAQKIHQHPSKIVLPPFFNHFSVFFKLVFDQISHTYHLCADVFSTRFK